MQNTPTQSGADPKLKKLNGPGKVSGIQPFFEKASEERGRPDHSSNGHISGFQLFSLFTADVIRSEQQFVR